MVSIIVAMTENNAIGLDNKLLFQFKEDMKHFVKLTKHNVVIMGRKTFESIGKELPNRINYVVSSNPDNYILGCKSVKEAVKDAKENFSDKEIFIIGGGQVYKTAIEEDIVDSIYATTIKLQCYGDTFFPTIDNDKWEVNEHIGEYEQDGISYSIVKYTKKNL